jgi:chromosome partitioning protein
MIISIASQKGGVGKTTTTLSLAAGLARRGRKVLVVDIDSQANSSKVLLDDYMTLSKEETNYETIINKKPLPIREAKRQNLYVSPSHIYLSETDIRLTTAMDHRESRLKDRLDEIKVNYDDILIDCPPALSWLTINAFTASDSVLVVISPGFFELDSIFQINERLRETQNLFNSKLKLLGYLFVMSEPTNNSKISLQMLRQTYGDRVFKTTIPRAVDVRDAHLNKMDIFEYNEKSKVSIAYDKLINEIYNGETEV